MKDAWIREALKNYEGPLTRYAYRVTRNLEQAREVVQDVFLKLWEEEPEKIGSHLPQWLFTVCRNRAIDLRRRDKRMVPLDSDDVEAIASEAILPDSKIENVQNRSQAMIALGRLPERQQEILRLKFQNGMSYSEIAKITGLTTSNVGFIIHTAMKNMKNVMAEKKSPKGGSHE